ncbi:MarR family transcriptional regulator [bacterium]|nr:MarR family transcriptional regulator [bacterium]
MIFIIKDYIIVLSTHYNGNQEEVVVLDAWIKLARANDTILHIIRPVIKRHGLTIAQFGTLESLLHLGPLGQNKIGQKLLVSGANMVKVVDNLERDNLVKRVTHPSDRRSNLIHLTIKGEALIKVVFKEHLQVLRGAFGVLSIKDLKMLADLCKQLGVGQKVDVL